MNDKLLNLSGQAEDLLLEREKIIQNYIEYRTMENTEREANEGFVYQFTENISDQQLRNLRENICLSSVQTLKDLFDYYKDSRKIVFIIFNDDGNIDYTLNSYLPNKSYGDFIKEKLNIMTINNNTFSANFKSKSNPYPLDSKNIYCDAKDVCKCEFYPTPNEY